MKNLIILFIFLAFSCASRDRNPYAEKSTNCDTIVVKSVNKIVNIENVVIIKKMDIERFNKNSDGDYSFTDTDGMEVRQTEDYDWDAQKIVAYYERRNYPNSPYTYVSIFNVSGILTFHYTEFYGFPIGVEQIYNEYGNSTDGKNYDTSYKFSIDDLITKMWRKYDIDILNMSRIWSVGRYIINEQPFYEVSVRLSFPIIEVYLINGNSGKTLMVTQRDTEWYPGKVEESVIDEYLKKNN